MNRKQKTPDYCLYDSLTWKRCKLMSPVFEVTLEVFLKIQQSLFFLKINVICAANKFHTTRNANYFITLFYHPTANLISSLKKGQHLWALHTFKQMSLLLSITSDAKHPKSSETFVSDVWKTALKLQLIFHTLLTTLCVAECVPVCVWVTGFGRCLNESVDDDGVGSCRQVWSGTLGDVVSKCWWGGGYLEEGGAESHCCYFQLSLFRTEPSEAGQRADCFWHTSKGFKTLPGINQRNIELLQSPTAGQLQFSPDKKEVRYLQCYEKLPKSKCYETVNVTGHQKVFSDKVDAYD